MSANINTANQMTSAMSKLRAWSLSHGQRNASPQAIIETIKNGAMMPLYAATTLYNAELDKKAIGAVFNGIDKVKDTVQKAKGFFADKINAFKAGYQEMKNRIELDRKLKAETIAFEKQLKSIEKVEASLLIQTKFDAKQALAKGNIPAYQESIEKLEVIQKNMQSTTLELAIKKELTDAILSKDLDKIEEVALKSELTLGSTEKFNELAQNVIKSKNLDISFANNQEHLGAMALHDAINHGQSQEKTVDFSHNEVENEDEEIRLGGINRRESIKNDWKHETRRADEYFKGQIGSVEVYQKAETTLVDAGEKITTYGKSNAEQVKAALRLAREKGWDVTPGLDKINVEGSKNFKKAFKRAVQAEMVLEKVEKDNSIKAIQEPKQEVKQEQSQTVNTISPDLQQNKELTPAELAISKGIDPQDLAKELLQNNAKIEAATHDPILQKPTISQAQHQSAGIER